MGLVNCIECGKQISESATSCPHCGFSYITTFNEGPATTIQKTYKKWKAVKLVSWLVIVSGILMLGGGELLMPIGASLIFFGFLGIIIAKLGAWWTTG